MGRVNSVGRGTTLLNADSDVACEVAGLPKVDTSVLKQLWVSICGAVPPQGLDRRLLIRALAYRLQERALGGLKPATRRLLLQLSGDGAAGPPARLSSAVSPGTVLVREWHGTSHRVTVLETACAWRGRRYRSLSEVARAITGTRWSGPRFFGLRRTRERGATNGTRPA